MACTTYILTVHRIFDCDICGFCSSTIYLFFVLMKKIMRILNRIARIINECIVWISLLIVYAVICVYRLFLKQDREQWQMRKNHNDELEQTKHLW